MKTVGIKSNILEVSDGLKAGLESAGRKRDLPPARVLFREDGESVGVFLVCKGKVLMGVRNMPKLDRVFSAGSLLGLPATFTGHPYTLTAVTVVQSDVVHVPREKFLQLMRARTDLCREATDMLGREVTFIQSALAERHRQMADAFWRLFLSAPWHEGTRPPDLYRVNFEVNNLKPPRTA
jgi:CRP-like cAMP-binding protein